MTGNSNDAVGVLAWGLRRYLGVMLACLLLGGALIPLLVRERDVPAEAEALVIAQRLDMDLSALPRYGVAVFNNGEVARAVATALGDLSLVNSVIPDRVSLVAEQDSIVFRVLGHDQDPATAAELANVAATAFVTALNAVGAGAGVFGLQNPAVPPEGEGQRLSTLLAVPIGLLAGLVLGLAAVSALLVARRPVIDAVDAEEATGVPALGIVRVPRARRGAFPPPEAFRGLMPVCRVLLSLPTPTVVVVSRPKDVRVREQISVAMATSLMRARQVSLVGSADLQAVVAERQADAVPPPAEGTGESASGLERLTLVDSREPLELVRPPEGTATLLVVPAGIRHSALRAAVVEQLGGSTEARIVLFKRGRWWRRVPAAPRPEAVEDRQPEPVGAASR